MYETIGERYTMVSNIIFLTTSALFKSIFWIDNNVLNM